MIGLSFPTFFMMFGGPQPTSGRLALASDIHLDIRARIDPDFGWFRMSGSNDLPIDGREFSFAIESEAGEFRAAVHA